MGRRQYSVPITLSVRRICVRVRPMFQILEGSTLLGVLTQIPALWSQTNHLQVIQNSLAWAVVKAAKFCHVTPIVKSLHWLKINERIEYKLFSYLQGSYHCSSYLPAQPDHCPAPPDTRSSSVVTLSWPPTSASLKITNCSFRYASPYLWNQLPVSFHQPCINHSADDVTLSNSSPTCSPLSSSVTHSFQSENLPFLRIFPP